MAQQEGATATPRPAPDPDDVTFPDPPRCALCDADIRIHPTVYDRWVSLAMTEFPAKVIPGPFRWRLVKIQAPHSSTVIDVVAVRVRGIDPLPGDSVIPAHQMSCADKYAERPSAKEAAIPDTSG
ncbi:DUF6083 domain-containing protein [Streptomyces sp. NPDC059597]|uniref:DUF6083 domain-containing protein n=1 Tax=Streptomyces sp. NPDC059597 TaxID=3346879 RepID=UPI0036750448